jgi:uncharacterized membrane protein SirB2
MDSVYVYLWMRQLHIGAAAVSFAGFALRGVWMLRGSPWLARRWVRVLPHVVDTVLLASAIWLAVASRQYPLTHDWLSVKVIGLLAYIGLGMVALHRGKTQTQRAVAWIGALAVYVYIVAVAMTRSAHLGL